MPACSGCLRYIHVLYCRSPSEQAEAVDHAQQASQMLPGVVQLPKMAGKALQTISIMKEDTSDYSSETMPESDVLMADKSSMFTM